MSEPPIRVVIAGGGVAGLEALLALHALARARVRLTLVAPEDEFVYRPLAVEEPYGVERIRQVKLRAAADHADAAFVAATIESVDSDRKIAKTSEGRGLDYDALALAVGARAVTPVAHAMVWDDRSDAETVGGLLQDIEQGYSRSLAVVVPQGPSWPLRGYELALFTTLQAKGMGIDLETTLVTPDPPAMALLGPTAVERITGELERAGVAIASAADVEVEAGHRATVVLHPSEERLRVDRVLALPGLRGRPIEGVPADRYGFTEVDDHCRVRGLDRAWAAGDSTSFPLKSGGFAAEQADVAAQDIAAVAGVDVEARPFAAAGRAELAGLPAGRFLKEWLAAGDEDALTTHLPATRVPVLTYLQRDLSAGWRGHR